MAARRPMLRLSLAAALLALSGCIGRGALSPREVLEPAPQTQPATPGIVPLTVEQDGEISDTGRR